MGAIKIGTTTVIDANRKFIGTSIDVSGNSDANSFRINGTTVIDSSRNLSNIGTISSSSVTISGTISTTGNAYFNGSYLYGDNKNMLQYSDGWLRLNQSGHFTSGTFSPYHFYLGSTLTVNGDVILGDNTGDTVDIAGKLRVRGECPIVDVELRASWAGAVADCVNLGDGWETSSYYTHGGHSSGDGVLESWLCVKRYC